MDWTSRADGQRYVQVMGVDEAACVGLDGRRRNEGLRVSNRLPSQKNMRMMFAISNTPQTSISSQ